MTCESCDYTDITIPRETAQLLILLGMCRLEETGQQYIQTDVNEPPTLNHVIVLTEKGDLWLREYCEAKLAQYAADNDLTGEEIEALYPVESSPR